MIDNFPRRPDFQLFKAFVKNKKVAVIGVGISNRPLIKLLHNLGADLTAFDRLPAEDDHIKDFREELAGEGIEIHWSLGPDYLSAFDQETYNLVFRTPVMRPDAPCLQTARAKGSVITSEMEVFMTFCPAEITGVTGSDGKTTTTSLIAALLKEEGYKVWLGGNIGWPLLARIEEIDPVDQVVLELSNFQLFSMAVSPERAVVTNLSPNHLNVHKDYREYVAAKRNIYRHQSLLDRVILNGRDGLVASFVEETKGQVAWFNQRPQEAGGPVYYLDRGWLCYQAGPGAEEEKLLNKEKIALPGDYNLENWLAALAACQGKVSSETIQKVASDFTGVQHRVELVRELDGVKYINSSIDSSPTRTKASLSIFRQAGTPLILITGGKDKNCDYSGLGQAILSCCHRVILCGENEDLITRELVEEADRLGMEFLHMTYAEACQPAAKENLGNMLCLAQAGDYEECLRIAKFWAEPGDTVLLSPAGTSFDRYWNFEERGDDFKRLVKKL